MRCGSALFVYVVTAACCRTTTRDMWSRCMMQDSAGELNLLKASVKDFQDSLAVTEKKTWLGR